MSRILSLEEIALWKAYTTGEASGGAMVVSDASALLRPSRRRPAISYLDLHGLTIAEAHKVTLAFIEEANRTHKAVTVITGLSGKIRREFPQWLETLPSIRAIEEMNGGGAFKIRFRKKKCSSTTE